VKESETTKLKNNYRYKLKDKDLQRWDLENYKMLEDPRKIKYKMTEVIKKN